MKVLFLNCLLLCSTVTQAAQVNQAGIDFIEMFVRNPEGYKKWLASHPAAGPMIHKAEVKLTSSQQQPDDGGGEDLRVTEKEYIIVSEDTLDTDEQGNNVEWTVKETARSDGYTSTSQFKNLYRIRPQ